MNNNRIENKIEKEIRKTNEDFIKMDLIPFLRIPSYTLNDDGTFKAKEFLKSYLSDFCSDINELKGEINPLILAKVKGEIKDPLLIYMMYDTQPINNERNWISPSFGAEIKTLPEPLEKLGDCIIARGAYNSKTPLLCFLNVIRMLKKENKMPISLMLLFDGEEEIGSPTLLNLLENRISLFNSCISAYYPSTKQSLDGKSVLKLGYKGIISLTINLYTRNEETHSAYSSMIPNAAMDLITLLLTIYFNNQFNINCLRNPYTLSDDDQSLLDDLFSNVDLEKIKRKAGIIHINEENPKEAFYNYLFKPTFNISTLKAGYQDKGIKNVVPNYASCNIDIRFAHNISVDIILKEIQEKINIFRTKTKSQIDLIQNVSYNGSRVNKGSILIKSLIKSFDKLGVSTDLWPLSAAAAPLSRIKEDLGLDFITGGLGIGGNAHAPNEFIQLSSILNTRLANYWFLKYFSQLYSKNEN